MGRGTYVHDPQVLLDHHMATKGKRRSSETRDATEPGPSFRLPPPGPPE